MIECASGWHTASVPTNRSVSPGMVHRVSVPCNGLGTGHVINAQISAGRNTRSTQNLGVNKREREKKKNPISGQALLTDGEKPYVYCVRLP